MMTCASIHDPAKWCILFNIQLAASMTMRTCIWFCSLFLLHCRHMFHMFLLAEFQSLYLYRRQPLQKTNSSYIEDLNLVVVHWDHDVRHHPKKGTKNIFKSAKPADSKPPPPNPCGPSWPNWSYCARFCSSLITSYAVA